MKLPELKLPEKLKPYKGVILFVVILMASNFLWKYNVIGDESENINSTVTLWGFNISAPFIWTAHHVAHVCESVLHLFGSKVMLSSENFLLYPNGNSVQIIWACTGLKQAYIFFCILAFYRGPWKHKLWYIPLGLTIVYAFNIFRITFITCCISTHPNWFTFLHLYFFKYLFYLVIFALWAIWDEKIVERIKPANLGES
jgi:exosortase/archaeosortase family protein